MTTKSNISPSVAPTNTIIRTYPQGYASTISDTESEGEGAPAEVDSDDEEQHSIEARLEQNRQYLDLQVKLPSGSEVSPWILNPQSWKTEDGTDVVLIRKPTASHLSHRLLNPFIYRTVENAGTLHDLAALLDTPDDWEKRYNDITADDYLFESLRNFRGLPATTPESDIQAHFIGLVTVVAARLGLHLTPRSETKIIVGGILARDHYDLRSSADPRFSLRNGATLIASEVKTMQSFPPGHMWYHSSRGVQVLSALYAFNGPTLLLTQKQWKLFVENADRNSVLTFPYGDTHQHSRHVKSSMMEPMGKSFLKALVICLLSKRSSVENWTTVANSVQELSKTPQKTTVKEKYFDTTEKPRRQSARLREALDDVIPSKKRPSFFSGYVDGQKVYAQVRVVAEDIVARIEGDIALEEKLERQREPISMEGQRETSSMTLFE
ncbi:hypothetical protein HDV05_007887 [Chytridiales sp. JEL 0842]|nr:hypothetical protein HDV05_007887 [Chytridiales sp. JEL 0842]